jgi:hypothetical protein
MLLTNNKILDLMVYFLYNFYILVFIQFKKKFQNFQIMELWSHVKGSRPFFFPKRHTFARYIPKGLFKTVVRFLKIFKKNLKFFFRTNS